MVREGFSLGRGETHPFLASAFNPEKINGSKILTGKRGRRAGRLSAGN